MNMNLKFRSTSGSPDNQAFRIRNMCYCLSTLNQSIPAACRVFYELYFWDSSTQSKALKHGTVSAVASMSKTNLSIYGKFTSRSSKSIYITNSINLPSASPVPWRVRSFIPSPSSSLYARKVARNQFVQTFIVRLFGQGNQFLNDTLLLLIKKQPKLGPAVFCNFQHSSDPQRLGKNFSSNPGISWDFLF